MNYLIKYIALGVGSIILLLAIKKLKGRKVKDRKIAYPLDVSNLDALEIELLRLEDVIVWFKENIEGEVESSEAILLKITHENQIKGKSIFDFKKLGLSLFLQGFYKIQSKQFSKCRFIITKKIDDNLKDQLGDEDMLVFE